MPQHRQISFITSLDSNELVYPLQINTANNKADDDI